MTPRIQLTSVPYAFQANSALTATTLSTAAAGYTDILQLTSPSTASNTITVPDATGTVCLQSSISCGFAPTTGGNYIAKNNQDTSTASYLGNLYTFTNTNTGAAGVLALNNSGTNSGISIIQSGTYEPSSGQALIVANNNTTTPSGNLLDLQNNGVSKFHVDVNGNVGVSGSETVSGSISIGTTSSQAGVAITITNGAWISSINSSGNGYINALSVNSNNQIQAGAALNIDGGIILPTDAGQVTFSDLPIDGTPSAGTPESYTFRVGSSNALTIYSQADGAGNAQNIRVAIGSSISPIDPLDVTGDINTSVGFTVAGAAALGNYLRGNGTNFVSSAIQATDIPAGSNYYIQNQNSVVQSGSNFRISGTAQASTFDASSAGVLNIGTTTATSIVLGQSTSIASNLRISVGTNGTATSQLYVSGNLPTTAIGTVATGNIGAVQGSYAYVISYSSGNLQVIDISNPSSPVVVGTVSAGYAGSVYVQGNYAYVTDIYYDSLQIINISNPYSPVTVGSFWAGSYTGSVYVQGNYAYVTNQGPDLQIINISNPASPVLVGTVSISYSGSVYVQGNYAYVTNLGGALQIINISNPASPVVVGSVSLGYGATNVSVQGNYAYVGNQYYGFQVIDVSNPASPVLVGTDYTATGDSYVQGRYAYVTGSSGLLVIDVSNPISPVTVGTITTGTSPNSVYVQGRYAYVASNGSGLQIFDLGGAYIQQLQAGGTETGTLTVDSNASVGGDESISGGLGIGQSLDVSGNSAIGGTLGVVGNTTAGSFLAVSSTDALDTATAVALNIGTTTATSIVLGQSTSLASTNRLSVGTQGTTTSQLYVSGNVPASNLGSVTTGTAPTFVYVQGRYAYVVNFTSNTLQVIDVSVPASPAVIGTSATTGLSGPKSVYVQGKYAYVANYTGSTLQIFDISNPASPTSVGSVTTGTNPYSVYVQGKYAYVVNYTSNTLQVIDVSNPTAPVVVGTSATTGLSGPRSIYVQGRYAYVANYTGSTLQAFDISNPASPTSVGSVTTGTNPYSVYVQGRYAYVTDFSSNILQVFDISNPASIPAAVGTGYTGGNPQSVYVQGRYAYVVNSTGATLQAFDISNPASPTSVGSAATGGSPYSVYVQGRYAYVANYTGKLLQTFDLGGSYIQQLEAGGAEVGTLSVDTNASIAGGESIGGSLGIGQSLDVSGNSAISGTLIAVGQVTFGSASAVNGSVVFANSTNAYTVTLASGATSTASYSLSLPVAAPTVGQCLQAGSVTASQLTFGSCTSVNTSITEVNSWNNNGTNSSSSSSTVAVSPANIGDELVVTTQETATTNDPITSVSGGGVTTWHKVIGLNGNSTVGRVEMWMGTITATGSNTVTVNYTSTLSGTNSWEDAATEFTAYGVNNETSWGVDTTGTQLNSAPSTTVTYPSLSPDAPEEVYVGYADTQYTGSAGSYGGFSYIVTSSNKVITYYSPGVVGTAYAPTASQGTSGESNTVGAILVAFVNSTAIDNSVSLQQGNFNVQAAGSASVAGMLEAGSTSPGDILDLKNNSGVNVASFGATGSVALQTSTNSTTAFQVENNSSVNVLAVDTSNTQVLIGTATASSANCSGTLSGNGVCLSSGAIAYVGNARPTEQITLTAEYAGAVLDPTTGANNIGTMTSGIDKTGSGGFNHVNYYDWTTAQATSQSYDVWVQVPIPKDFSAWSSTTPMTVLVNSSTTTAGTIGVAVYDSTGTQVTQTGGTMVDITPGSANTWTAQTPTSANINFSSGTFTASSTFSLDLRLTAPTSGNINVGTITLTYLRAY
jgi:hypothetical protein